MTKAVELVEIKKEYTRGREQVHALRGVSLSVELDFGSELIEKEGLSCQPQLFAQRLSRFRDSIQSKIDELNRIKAEVDDMIEQRAEGS